MPVKEILVRIQYDLSDFKHAYLVYASSKCPYETASEQGTYLLSVKIIYIFKIKLCINTIIFLKFILIRLPQSSYMNVISTA